MLVSSQSGHCFLPCHCPLSTRCSRGLAVVYWSRFRLAKLIRIDDFRTSRWGAEYSPRPAGTANVTPHFTLSHWRLGRLVLLARPLMRNSEPWSINPGSAYTPDVSGTACASTSPRLTLPEIFIVLNKIPVCQTKGATLDHLALETSIHAHRHL